MSKEIIIREIREAEIGKLEDMLHEAIFQPDVNNLIPRTVLEIPEVNVYIKDFGKLADDYCLVADLNGKIVGAVWTRILSGEVKGFGYVDNKTPEFSIESRNNASRQHRVGNNYKKTYNIGISFVQNLPLPF